MSSSETSIKKHYWLYILKLQHDKYYVGITAQKNPQTRIDQHKNGYLQARWVAEHPYLETVEIIDIGTITKDDAELLEERHTSLLIEKYGLNSVRGGSLNYHGKYVKFGRYYFTGWDAYTLGTVLFLMGSILILIFLK